MYMRYTTYRVRCDKEVTVLRNTLMFYLWGAGQLISHFWVLSALWGISLILLIISGALGTFLIAVAGTAIFLVILVYLLSRPRI
jgi:hypothetical protein